MKTKLLFICFFFITNNLYSQSASNNHGGTQNVYKLLEDYIPSGKTLANEKTCSSFKASIIMPEGEGTAESPLLIASLSNLAWIVDNPQHWDLHYLQNEDIDASETSQWNYGMGWTPIGNSTQYFSGEYNGDNHVLSGLYINRPYWNDVGLFGATNGAEIRNVHLINLQVVEGGRYTGGLAGSCYETTISGCSTEGTVSGQTILGGLIGYISSSSVIRSQSNTTVTQLSGYQQAGGLIGRAHNYSYVSQCFSSGVVNGQAWAAGLVGVVTDHSQITDSYSSTSVSGEISVGGLIARIADSTVERTYTTGFVSGIRLVGGHTAEWMGKNESNDSFWNIETSYVNVSALGQPRNTREMLSQTNYSGWDFNGIWSIYEGETYPFLTLQMDPDSLFNYPPHKLPPSFLSATGGDSHILLEWQAPSMGDYLGFHIYRDNVIVHATEPGVTSFVDRGAERMAFHSYKVAAVYQNTKKYTLPITAVIAHELQGEGTEERPFIVSDAIDLFAVRNNLSAHYLQVSDIDLNVENLNSGKGWVPIGNLDQRFTGEYDGGGYRIKNLIINDPELFAAGLFGLIYDAKLQNVRIEDAAIHAANRTGILVGRSRQSEIVGCSATGDIHATGNWTGGLIGVTFQGSIVRESYSTANIKASGYSVGGLSGTVESNSSVINCYATGNMEASNWVGGLTGWVSEESIVENCYAMGKVTAMNRPNSGGLIGGQDNTGQVINSFWNTTSTGMNHSAGGTGKTLDQMIKKATFVSWDFNHTWDIIEEETHPFFQWQKEPAFYNIGYHTVTLKTNDGLAGSLEGQERYLADSLVVIKAVPNEGYGFINWTFDDGREFGKEHIRYFEMPEKDLVLTANFSEIKFAGGSGTSQDPWQVATAEQFNNIRQFLGKEHGDKHFVQIANINLGESPWSDGSGWLPIGTVSNRDQDYDYNLYPFSGTYDGQDHVIDSFRIQSDAEWHYQNALFFRTDSAQIRNLGLTNVNIRGFSFAAPLVGWADNHTVIENCFSTGSVSVHTDAAAGLVAYMQNHSILRNTHSECKITHLPRLDGEYDGTGLAGGLVAVLERSTIENSYFNGAINGTLFLGGLAGALLPPAGGNQSSNISEPMVVINKSFNIGKIRGFYAMGGLVGGMHDPMAIISDSYSSGEVLGETDVDIAESFQIGGIVGQYLEGILRNVYATSTVIGDNETGGLSGMPIDENNVQSSFWDIEASLQESSGAGLGKTTADMVIKNTFDQWDFDQTWAIHESETYPYLQWQETPWSHNYPAADQMVTVSVDPDEGGVANGSGIYRTGHSVQISATPNDGYRFASWTADGVIVSTKADYSFIATKDQTLIAHFVPKSISIGLDSYPSDNLGGMVTGAGNYTYGMEVTIEAVANVGYGFYGWMVGDSLLHHEAAYTFMPESDMNITAHFTSASYAISAQSESLLGGSAEGSGTYYHGDVVSVEAIPLSGYYFLRWMEDGNQVSVRNPYLFSATADRVLIAQFAPMWWDEDKADDKILVTATVSPPFTGVILGQGTYNPGQQVRLEASPNVNIDFTAWREDGVVVNGKTNQPNNVLEFEAEQNRQLEAIFDGNVLSVQVTVLPEASGVVEVSHDGAFFSGDYAELSAMANPGYRFLKWTTNESDVPISVNPEYGFSVSDDTELIAHFAAKNRYTVTLDVYPDMAGTSTGGGNFVEGSLVNISAEANTGHTFIYWRIGPELFSSTRDTSFLLTTDSSIEAFFRVNTYSIMASAGEHGSIHPSGVTEIKYTDSQTFRVVPDEGYMISFIKIDGYTVDMQADENWDNENKEYTLSQVSSNKTIEVGFEQDVTGADQRLYSDMQLKVYPNPAKNNLWVEFYNQGNDRAILRMFSLQGQTLLNKEHTGIGHQMLSLNIEHLPVGVYLFQIQKHDVIETVRVLIE